MKKGFITLVVVLTLSAISLAISAAILLRSITESTVSVAQEASNKSWAAVNGCVESALLTLASSTNPVTVWTTYSTPGNVSIGEHSCYYEISGSGTSTERVIHASSTVDSYVRKISTTVSTNTPSMIIESWDIVADF